MKSVIFSKASIFLRLKRSVFLLDLLWDALPRPHNIHNRKSTNATRDPKTAPVKVEHSINFRINCLVE